MPVHVKECIVRAILIRPVAVIGTMILLISCFRVPSVFAAVEEACSYEDNGRVVFTGTIYDIAESEKSLMLRVRGSGNVKCIVYCIHDTTRGSVSAAECGYKLGYTVEVSGTYHDFECAGNPGEFDSRAYYAVRGIQGRIYASGVTVLSAKPDVLLEKLRLFKHAWTCIIDRIYGEKPGSIMKSMLLGDRSDIDAGWRDVYTRCGIAHILAISGLHISFLGKALCEGLQRFFLPGKAAAAASCILLLFYVVMTGGSASAVRAFIFFTVLEGAVIFGRSYDRINAFFLALSIILLSNPLYVTDAGFCLSFASSAFIGIASWYTGGIKTMRAHIAEAAVFQVLMLPAVLYFFFQFSVYSILLNFFVIPGMSLILTGGFVSLGVGMVSSAAGHIAAFPGETMINAYTWLSSYSLKLPCSGLVFGKPSVLQIVAYYALLCSALYMIRAYKRRLLKAFGLCLIAMSVLLLRHPTDSRLYVTILDVGQGDSICISVPSGNHYLIDCGSADVREVGRYRLIPYLKAEGIKTLECIFLTHLDSDHKNGIEEMLTASAEGNGVIKAEHLAITPSAAADTSAVPLLAAASASHVPVSVLSRGSVIRDGDVVFRVLSPSGVVSGEDDNDDSLVLMVEYGRCRILLTGDLEAGGEESLLAYTRQKRINIDCTVLKVGHHGSDSSSREAFLNAVKPEYALISAGRNNKYHHPHRETIHRIKEADAACISTQTSGAITVSSDGTGMCIRTFCRRAP